MEKIPVLQWMTPHPFTTTPNALIVDAYHLMKEHRIRRLPVLEDSKLIGIITLDDVRRMAPLGLPDMLEINYVLSQIKVERVMSREVISIQADAPVHEAARLMLEHKLGGLPVLKNEELVGIITEADIFRMVIQQNENITDF